MSGPSRSNRNANVILDNFFRDARNTSHVLDLSACQLSSIPEDFAVLIAENPAVASRLTQLNLAHNSLTTLPSCLAQLPNLRILFLLNNNFTHVPAVVRQLSAVTMLSFKENALEGMLDAATLPPNLTWLILTSNNITALSPDFSTKCAHVRKLMLSNNLLSNLPADFGTRMKSLELLRIANNKFDKVPPSLLDCPALVWLSLAGNPCTGGSMISAQLPNAQAIDLEREYLVDWESPFGSGASGTAFPGVHRENGSRVAVKKFKSLHGSDGRALDEVHISLAAADVEGVVSAKGFCLRKDSTGQEEMILVSELVPGRAHTIAGPPSFDTCTRSVYPEGLKLSEADSTRIINVVELAVEGLLARGIAHGDIYGHNVLVGQLDDVLVVKLGDLGAAWRFDESNRERVTQLERRALDIFRKEVMALVG